MKKKVRKFASGGDIITGLGAVLIGKALYDKYKGKDQDEGKAKLKYDEEKAAPEKKKDDSKGFTQEARDKYLEERGAKPLQETGTRANPYYKEDEPAPKKSVVTTTPKKAASTAKKAPAASESSNTTPLTYYTPKAKRAEPVSKPYPQAEATARLKKAEAERRAGQGLTPRAEYTGPGSRQHIEGLRLERSQRLEEEAKKQFEKNKRENEANKGMKRGGAVKKYASGGSVGSASKRADGIAQRGKTKGRIC
jgi:hypothetical protein